MIKNITKNSLLIQNFEYCTSILRKFLGLMFSKKRNRGLIFVFSKEKLISLHMFFVFYPIDVLWLNGNKKVVKIKEHFKPFRFVFSDKPAKYILELPNNTIKRTKTALGDTINFK